MKEEERENQLCTGTDQVKTLGAREKKKKNECPTCRTKETGNLLKHANGPSP
jgi:hypothetical protein